MSTALVLLLFVTIGTVLALKRIKIVHQDQRLLVERFGRFHRVCGPGRHLIIPFVEQAHLVRLNEMLPEWTGLSEERIQEQVARRFYGGDR